MKFDYSIERMCKVLKVSRSGFYEWQNRDKTPKVDPLEKQVCYIFNSSRKTYGHRSIRKELIKAGEPIGRKRVLRIMKVNKIRASNVKPSSYVIDCKSKEDLVSKNRLMRNFSPTKPNQRGQVILLMSGL